jgi:uncharacterized RDD family membrane protein YckC
MVIADKGARLGNMIVDTIVYWLLAACVSLLLGMLEPFISYNVSAFLDVFYLWILYVAYYFCFELLLGKTPGKYLTKTTVVDRHGNKPSAGRLLIRSLMRIIFYDWFTYIFGVTGLHDTVSRTLVVKDER